MILFTNKNYTQSFIYTIAAATEEKTANPTAKTQNTFTIHFPIIKDSR